jgi:hypothetical protein
MIENWNHAMLAGLASISGPLMFFRGFHDFRVLRLVEDTPTARIRSMPMGLVEVKGRLHPRSRSEAPFTGRPCLYWEVEVSSQRGRRGGWQVVHRNQSRQPFYVEDETGIAMVYPEGARCTVHDTREETCMGLNLPPVYSEYIGKSGGLGLQLNRLGILRFRERILEAGQPVYLLGSAFPRAQAVSLGDEDALAATGTDDGAGLVERTIRDLDRRACAVIRRGQNESTFLISQDGEFGVRAGFGLKSAAQLIGGPIITLAGLAYWLMALN